MMKRVLLLLSLLIVQYALSGDDIETGALSLTPSPTVPIRSKTIYTPQPSIPARVSYLQSMKDSSEVVQRKKAFAERKKMLDGTVREELREKEGFAKKTEKFAVIFGEVIKKQSKDTDFFFDMEMDD